MQYTVDLAIRTRRPLTESALFAVAELGGAAVGRPGGRQLETTLTVAATGARKAAERASDLVLERVAGTVVAVEVMTTTEADRRLAERHWR